MGRRAARLLLRGEGLRTRAKELVVPGARPFSDPRAWSSSAETAEGREFEGEALRWTQRGTTLEVTLERPPCNEIGSRMLGELEELADHLVAGAGGARAMIIHSALGSGFSAGADLRELYEGLRDRRERGVTLLSRVRELRGFIDRIHRVFDIFDRVPITTVSAVHGVVFGGGFELALTTDLIVADKSARFCFPELRLGLVPGFGGVPRLERDLGNAVVRDLLLTGRSLRASRAHGVGLVSQVVGRGRALEVAREVAAQAAKLDRATTTAAKAFVKPLPLRRLAQERALFTSLFTSPVVEQSLRRFVLGEEKLPYLP